MVQERDQMQERQNSLRNEIKAASGCVKVNPIQGVGLEDTIWEA